MNHIAKRSAASRKAWRTRKRMQKARDDEEMGLIMEAWRLVVAKPKAPASPIWPTYMDRALPNPWNKALPPW